MVISTQRANENNLIIGRINLPEEKNRIIIQQNNDYSIFVKQNKCDIVPLIVCMMGELIHVLHGSYYMYTDF